MTQPIAVRTDPPKPEDIRAQYGFVALIAQQIPEIGGLMEQAVKENWTADRFSLALAATNWWKSTPDPVRQWAVKNIADPASAEAELNAGAAKIRADLTQLGLGDGVGMTGRYTADQRQRELWLQASLKGLDDAGRRQHIWSQVSSQWDSLGGGRNWRLNLGGVYGQGVTEMTQLAAQYGYSAPDLHNRILDTADRSMRGGGAVDTEAWRRSMMSYASAKYAPFADRINGGETVMDIARPYMESYAKTLEVNPQDISLDDNALQKALQGNGKAAQAVWQFEQDLRKDTRYGYTRGARDAAAQTLQAIGKTFGMVG